MTTHLLPENLRGAQDVTGGISCAVATETCVGHSVTGPGQGALERAAQVVKCPGYNYIIVETYQRGHTQHPDANT